MAEFEQNLDQMLSSALASMNGEDSAGADTQPGPAEGANSDADAESSSGTQAAGPVGDEAAEVGDGRPRDEKGRFVKAPSSWKAAAREKWATLDPDIQEEVDRREGDFHRGIDGYKERAERYDRFEKAVLPYKATMNSLGLDAETAVSNLMSFDHSLRYSQPHVKLDLWVALGKAYGIDVDSLLKSQQQDQPYVDPEVQSVRNELAQLRQTFQQREQQAQQSEIAGLQAELEKFQTDPAHEHFEAVRSDMAVLLRSGAAGDLKSAYEKAVWGNPETRKMLVAKQQEAARHSSGKIAAKARQAASVNIHRRGTIPAASQELTIDQALMAKAKELGLLEA